MLMKNAPSLFTPRLLLALICGLMLAGCSSGLTLKGSKDEGLKLARLLRDQGRLEAASEVYARLDARGKLNGAEMLEYATVSAPVQQPAQALALYGRARNALGGNIDKMADTEALALCLGMGRAELALGRMTTATKDFECALRRDGSNATALNGMGVLLDAQGRHDEARRRFEQALQSEPGNVAVMNNLALSWLSSGQPDRAIGQLRTADMNNPSLRLNLALAYLYKGDESAARDTLSHLAASDRIDGLIATLSTRADELKQKGGNGNPLLLASTQMLPLSENAQ
ncbi:tetratricopeptide repeat protein [Pantoea coffeiphila]|uniref:tetratricopeptide repeat protein n=1 Tax=Pantoea coffeiphila TaxID=1465635 RepID=UPI00195FC660